MGPPFDLLVHVGLSTHIIMAKVTLLIYLFRKAYTNDCKLNDNDIKLQTDIYNSQLLTRNCLALWALIVYVLGSISIHI